MGSTHTIANRSGLSIAVADTGRFDVADNERAWAFAGRAGARLAATRVARGRDRAGAFKEISFDFDGPNCAARRGAIRLYDRGNVVLFELTFVDAGTTAEAFPVLSTYPRRLHHLTYTGIFGRFSFGRFGTDGPWAFFDDRANAVVLSPAAHFMNGAMSHGPRGQWRSGLVADDKRIPAGFVHRTVLVTASGINRAFDVWGRFLTDLAGKKRPANDADMGLKYLGYWTDHGARYYYRWARGSDYPTTLLKIRDEFRKAKVGLGYMQLDSWFYRKGARDRWQDVTKGTYLYEASRELFPNGLAAFQKKLGVPLITHSRWLDKSSPYRERYDISGNVAVDPALWRKWMRYLKSAGVRTYEQDWLSGPALPERTLEAGERFMDAMADASRREGLTLQLCMALPRHYLQGSNYSHLTTIRPSGDRFKEQHWRSFVFDGRLASALGIWPWADVFKSSETANLLLATLSGGMVGVGDGIGKIDWTSVLRAVRRDGAIVKPDEPLTPLDQCYVAYAKDKAAPIVAAARTVHDGWITSYIIAFGARAASVSPAALGYDRPVYVYDYFRGTGRECAPADAARLQMAGRIAYAIVVPIGTSGVVFLGDADKFVSNGRRRILGVTDKAGLTARVSFATGEDRVRLRGYARRRPALWARDGRIENITHDSRTGLFQFDLLAAPGTVATVAMQTSSR